MMKDIITFQKFMVFFCVCVLGGCASTSADQQVDDIKPPMRWDFHPEALTWTSGVLGALENHGAALARTVPSDIETFCPAYPMNDDAQRRAFWAGLFSALAKHESTWNPAAAGGGGQWIGLLQISPRTARYYGCQAQSASALKNGVANLSCAVRIATVQVQKDNMVAGNGTRGVGRDWAPFRSAAKRSDISQWTSAQSYCQ